jgi:charged multivesicular body protein 7
VIKFAEDDASREITSLDRGVLELKTTIEKVEQQIEQIQVSITTCVLSLSPRTISNLSPCYRRTAQIKAALLASRQEIAKIQLKSRNAFQALLTQRLGTLSTLTAALASIDQAHGDAEILRAYDGSARVLKEILSRDEMKEERVEGIMEELRVQMEGAESVRRAVEEGGWEVVEAAGLGGKDEGEEELQRELESLVQEGKREEEKRRLDGVVVGGVEHQIPVDEEEKLIGAMQRLAVTQKEEKVAELA